MPEQTVALLTAVKHAISVGISIHFECLVNGDFEGYEKENLSLGGINYDFNNIQSKNWYEAI